MSDKEWCDSLSEDNLKAAVFYRDGQAIKVLEDHFGSGKIAEIQQEFLQKAVGKINGAIVE